jgi:ubiquinone/menaquinone biosynthesis C-methylase UbiE
MFKKDYKLFFEFREKGFGMSDEEIGKVYEIMNKNCLMSGCDLNKICIEEIIKDIKGESILDAGCGRGFLISKLIGKYKVSGADVVIEKDLKEIYPKAKFFEVNIEKLPFKDKSFDTVICSHTLEHCRDIRKAVSELRRVTRKRLIIVIPRERPYKFGFNLHLHFFPYKFSIEELMGNSEKIVIKNLGGDWYVREEF